MAAEEYSFHDRVMHHLGSRRIDANNGLAVEFACILETGTIVTDKHTMENKEIDVHFEEEMLESSMDSRPRTSRKGGYNTLCATSYTGPTSPCKAIVSRRSFGR